MTPIIVWLRQDLRVADNPALHAAAATGRPVVPLFILDSPGAWGPGGASIWWLEGSLRALAQDLEKRGAALVLRRGNAAEVLDGVIAATGATAVYWNRCYEPAAIARDQEIKAGLRERGMEVESFAAAVLFEPWTLKTKTGGPYRVFTPFHNATRAITPRRPLPAPRRLSGMPIAGEDLSSWNLRPTKPDWAGGLREMWTPGETAARARLVSFLDDVAADYHRARDVPGVEGTSRLSPHLHFGEISPHQIWAIASALEPTAGIAAFQRELIWREFSTHLLYHFPHMPKKPLRSAFARFPWRRDVRALKAWQQGLTGYPIVDAGMRELWHTGWMHNRVRMIVASFLVKHLLLRWQDGAAWFWDTLVDADLANNAASWQWVAGCGMDAAPYFRIFNPMLQGAKFDAEGVYVRRWVPELGALPDAYLHAPWDAPDSVLAAARVQLGKTYPRPIVDHAAARVRALAALKDMSASNP